MTARVQTMPVARSNADGTVTVTGQEYHRLSELLDTAAQAFATSLERPVPWPTLLATRELAGGRFAATYVLEGTP
jgi:hypothetical protein